MMDAVFVKLLNMSITASWLTLAVILLRFALKKAPKWIRGVLWGFVAFRLICPFSLESVFSLIPSAETIDLTVYGHRPYIETGVSAVDSGVNNYLGGHYFEGVTVPADNTSHILTFFGVIWIIGFIAMLAFTIVSYIRICKRVCEAVPLEDNIWICDRISTPFILGIIRPRIYLPSSMNEEDMQYVISHEKAHLKRKDHIWKPLGFLLLSVYWFNPILWVAYILLCKDIELACDEKVIRQFGAEIKKPYSDALINCSVPRKMISACPLAFGETSVKERVKGVLNYKKPAFWLIVAAVAVCVITAVCLLTNPMKIKITQIKEGPDFSGLFSNIQTVTVYSGENNYTTNDEKTIREMTAILQDIRIKSRPVLQSRAEDRDNMYRITIKTINDNNTLCFSEDFSELWIDNGVKPTYSYKVLNPSKAKSIFEIKPAEKITSGFSVVDKGSDIEGVSLSITAVNLDSERPSIRVEWKNDSKNEVTFPEDFDILYYKDGEPISCLNSPLYTDLLANVLLPKGSQIKVYDVSSFDLSKWGRYRFQVEHSEGVYSWIDFEIVLAQGVSISGADEPNTVTAAPLEYSYSSGLHRAELSLDTQNKRIAFSFSQLSSYWPHGTYEENENYIIMKTDYGDKTYTFQKRGSDLIFIASKSSEVPSYKYSENAQPKLCVPDGAVFKPNGQ